MQEGEAVLGPSSPLLLATLLTVGIMQAGEGGLTSPSVLLMVGKFGTAFFVALITAGMSAFMASYVAATPGAGEAEALSSALSKLSCASKPRASTDPGGAAHALNVRG